MKKNKIGTSGGKNSSLSAKISKRLLIVMVAVFVIIALIIILLSKSIISNLSVEECNGISEKNFEQVSAMTQIAVKADEMATKYLESNFSKLENQEGSYPSAVFVGATIPTNAGKIEEYILQLASSTVENYEAVQGMGIFFEPGTFGTNVENYGFYVNKDETSDVGTKVNIVDAAWEQDYYTEPMASGRTFVTEPYEDFGDNMITVSKPIILNGKPKGIVLIDILLSEFEKIKATSESYPTMFAILLDEKGNLLYHSGDRKAIMSNIKDRIVEGDEVAKLAEDKKAFETVITFKADDRKVQAFFVPIDVAGATWWTYTGVDVSDLNKEVVETGIILIVLFIIALVVLVVMLSYQIRKNLKPLSQLSEAGNALVSGDFSYDITYNGNDEIGKACDEVRVAFVKLKEIIKDLDGCMEALQNGDLTRTMEAEYPGEFGGVHNSYIALLEKLNGVFAEIKNSSNQINKGAEQVSTGAQSLSQSSTQQAASVEQLSATIGDIYEKIKRNSGNAEEVNTLAKDVGVNIENSTAYMNNLMVSMEKMTDASNEVEKIIKTIDDIAFQTNILALNAAVEAARAGEAGKGFAVVADEVRNLAVKSAEAAKTTTTLIGTAIEAVAEGSGIAQQTAESLNQVVENVNTIITRISEIANSSEEQATSASQINQGADQISAAVQTNSATSQESAAASEELAGQATVLDGLVAQFRLKDDKNVVKAKHEKSKAKDEMSAREVETPKSEPVPARSVKPAPKPVIAEVKPELKEEKKVGTVAKAENKAEAPAFKELKKQEAPLFKELPKTEKATVASKASDVKELQNTNSAGVIADPDNKYS